MINGLDGFFIFFKVTFLYAFVGRKKKKYSERHPFFIWGIFQEIMITQISLKHLVNPVCSACFPRK